MVSSGMVVTWLWWMTKSGYDVSMVSVLYLSVLGGHEKKKGVGRVCVCIPRHLASRTALKFCVSMFFMVFWGFCLSSWSCLGWCTVLLRAGSGYVLVLIYQEVEL